MYVETLGKWRSADLLIGLAYLARKDGAEHPVADIARHGVLAGVGLSPPQRLTLVVSTAARSCRSRGRGEFQEGG